MNNRLIKIFLKINSFFPIMNHPFNGTKKGVLDLNYTDFEYAHTKDLLKMYSKFIDLELLKNKKILDLGCGGGGKAIYIAEKYGSRTTGIDLNLTFLKEANKEIKEKELSKLVYFKEEDALNTTFKNESFDIIIMSDVIEHIPNTEKLFKEARRILKKGGFILFDFAPYYHKNGHHIWDTIRIPWVHLFTTENFRIKLYKESVKGFMDAKKRIKLRIGLKNKKEEFCYLNKITRKKFENIIFHEKSNYQEEKITYFMFKDIDILSKIPLVRELFIKHIVGVLKK